MTRNDGEVEALIKISRTQYKELEKSGKDLAKELNSLIDLQNALQDKKLGKPSEAANAAIQNLREVFQAFEDAGIISKYSGELNKLQRILDGVKFPRFYGQMSKRLVADFASSWLQSP